LGKTVHVDTVDSIIQAVRKLESAEDRGAGNSAGSRLSAGSGRLKGGLQPRLAAPQGKLTHYRKLGRMVDEFQQESDDGKAHRQWKEIEKRSSVSSTRTRSAYAIH
jgi:hypothetical protein